MTDSPEVTAVLAKLKDVKRSGRGYTARCPAHDDKRASLSASSGHDGKLLLKCHSGCKFGDIIAALDLPKQARSPQQSKTVYPYLDESGTTLYEVHRSEPKKFSQCRPDGQGNYIWKLDDVRRVLFRLPELIKAVALERTIYITEGEKDVTTLVSHGFDATTVAGGASAKWLEGYSESLSGADIVLLPDNDEPGATHMQKIAAALTGVAKRVRTVNLPGLRQKEDVTDWMMYRGGTPEKLIALTESAQIEEPVTVDSEGTLPRATCMRDAPPPEALAWAIEDLVPAAEPSIFFGIGGSGKSTIVLHAACAVAGGYKAFGHFNTVRRPVLIVSAEDSASILRSRAEAMCRGQGWDTNAVIGNLHYYALEGVSLSDPKWCAMLMAEIARLAVGLVILDPLQELVTGEQNSASEMQPHIRTMRAFCQPTKAAVIVVHHAGKGARDKSESDLIRGSSAFHAFARSAYLITEASAHALSVKCVKMSRTEKPASFVVERYVDADPANALLWTSARFNFVTAQQAAFDSAEAFVLEQVDMNGRMCTSQLKDAAKGTGVKVIDISKAIKSLEMRGIFDFEEGDKNRRDWGRKQPALVATRARQPEIQAQTCLPGNLGACQATSPIAAPWLPPSLEGNQAGNVTDGWATREEEAA